MIIKPADSKQSDLVTLEQLRQRPDATNRQQQAIEKEINNLRAGIKGEKESAYLIDFDCKSSKHTAVIHDLRLEGRGGVAQIDHLLIHRTLTVFVLETKHFNFGIKITDEGEFLRWNDYKKTFEGMSSPLAQNDRHIKILKEAFDFLETPTRMGIRLSPSYESYVLVSTNARIDRSPKFDSSRVIKADVLLKTIKKQFEDENILDTLGKVSRIVSTETLELMARKLSGFHSPSKVNYLAKFGFGDVPAQPSSRIRTLAPEDTQPVQATTQAKPPNSLSAHTCRSCGSTKISVQYGKYGYYFKCAACDSNTPIKISCGIAGHKERIRKDGIRFFRECADCKTSSLYFENT